MSRPAASPTSVRPPAADGGFTLVEMLMAMAVFAGLMAIVGAATLSGFSGIRDVTRLSEVQQESQSAAEWASRLLRYAEVPEGQTVAITEASPTSITWFTYSGTGAKTDVPYKARLYVVTALDGSQTLWSEVRTPTRVAGGWTWLTDPVSRRLLSLPAAAGVPLTVSVSVCNPDTDCAATRRIATPTTSGPIALSAVEVPASVTLSIGDHDRPENVVTQQVRLVNLS